MDREMSTRDVLREKCGVCREYVKIFSEMCDIAGFRVKCIRGFAKGPNYIPGKGSYINHEAKFLCIFDTPPRFVVIFTR